MRIACPISDDFEGSEFGQPDAFRDAGNGVTMVRAADGKKLAGKHGEEVDTNRAMRRGTSLIVALGMIAGLAMSGGGVAFARGPEVIFNYETGGAAVLDNDGRYGAGGTKFDADATGQTRNLAIVERATVEFGFERHRIILLYAPFELKTRTRFDEAFVFRDTTFAPGQVLDHRYLFDGYRASYLYDVVHERGLSLGLGGSLQVRNADVAFTAVDGSGFAQESDIGLVFALKARLRYSPGDCVWGQLEADAFSTFGLIDGVKGGIYDLAATIGVPVSGPLDVYFTTRLVGGGATVEDRDFENWANFLSFSLGVRVAL